MGKNHNGNANEDPASRLLHALSHPLRRQIINALTQEPASATMLADVLDVHLSNVSYHLSRVLFEKCDVVRVVQRNQRRGAMETVFALKTEAFVGAFEWPTIPGPLRSGLRGLALSSFQSAAIAALEAEGEDPYAASVYVYRPVSVDADGQREIGEAIKEFTGKVKAVEDRCSGLDPIELLHLIIGTAAFKAAPRSS